MLDIGGPVENPAVFDDVLKELEKEGHSNVIVADSIEELAGKIGIDSYSLTQTIEEYNRACETGRDHALNKKARYLKPIKSPKFYARRCFSMPSGLPEGITINHRTEVLNEDFKAIPGLYAAGADTACNVYREIYVNVLPGNAMGWALNSGVIAAENAVEYIKIAG